MTDMHSRRFRHRQQVADRALDRPAQFEDFAFRRQARVEQFTNGSRQPRHFLGLFEGPAYDLAILLRGRGVELAKLGQLQRATEGGDGLASW